MRVQVARIGKPHGIRGEVTAQVLTDAPAERFAPGERFEVEPAGQGPLTVAGARWNKDILLLAFEEVADRTAAEALRGARLFAESVEDADDDDAWYEHELQGLQVRVGERAIGTVAALRTHAAQDLLVIEDLDGREVLVPFVAELVPEIDVEAGYLVLDPPPGLLELNRTEDGR